MMARLAMSSVSAQQRPSCGYILFCCNQSDVSISMIKEEVGRSNKEKGEMNGRKKKNGKEGGQW